MENSGNYISLFYDLGEDNFKIKTNLREEKIDEFLTECYIATKSISCNFSSFFHKKEIYNIDINFDSASNIFKIYSDTGNKIWTFELIKYAINNWKILSDKLNLDKKGIEGILAKNLN